jgi:UDP-3-O-[3-hydroxymyristoyl] glucosamine N-acyltransferase
MKTREIAEFLGAELVGNGDIEISSVASISTASEGQLAFVERSGSSSESNASCLIVPKDLPAEGTHIKVDDPKLAFARVSRRILPSRHFTDARDHASISANAEVRADVIGAYVTVGEGSYVAEGCVLAEGVHVGRDVEIGMVTILHPNAVVYDGVKIGQGCVIHSGCILGADGFGYVKDESGNYLQFPQAGTLVIEDNVEIGANTCIDRGSLGETRIGEGTKIDNLVQIGHNVRIGKRVVIAAQTGISGSTVVEDDCVIGGQVGMGDHATVKSGAIIGSQAGVLPGKIVRPGVWWGTPVQPLDEYKRQNAMIKGLGRLRDEVRDLKAAMSERPKKIGSPKEREE